MNGASTSAARTKKLIFRNAPVVETLIGVQFLKQSRLQNALLGAYWATRRDRWPHATDAPPLSQVFELFGEQQVTHGGIQVEVGDFGARLQLANADNTRMLQIQNGWIILNWRKQEGTAYPHYEEMKKAFFESLEDFAAFVRVESKLEPLSITQWEVTYVNEIPKGTVWGEHSDLVRVFPGLVGGHTISSGKLESLQNMWTYELKDPKSRLYVHLQSARRSTDPRQEVVLLRLTSRGTTDGDGPPLDGKIDIGHQAIVHTFDEVASENARKYWQRDFV